MKAVIVKKLNRRTWAVLIHGQERARYGTKSSSENEKDAREWAERYARPKKLATLTKEEDAVWVFAFEFYLRNVRNNSRHADSYAWGQTKKFSPRLVAFDGCEVRVK